LFVRLNCLCADKTDVPVLFAAAADSVRPVSQFIGGCLLPVRLTCLFADMTNVPVLFAVTADLVRTSSV
jgi:hypothetical protein